MTQYLDLYGITLSEYIAQIYKKRWFVVLIIFLFLLSMGLFTYFSEKKYMAVTTFRVEGALDMAQSAMITLASSNQNALAERIKLLIEGQQFKQALANKFIPYFKDQYGAEIMGSSNEDKRDFVFRRLQLETKFDVFTSRSWDFKLTYTSTDQVLAKAVLDEALELALNFNESLGFSKDRNFFVMIEAPQHPKDPYSPNLAFNMILGFVYGVLFSLLTVLAMSRKCR